MLRAFSRRPRWWLAVVQVVLLVLSIAVPAAAATDPSPTQGLQMIQLLKSYGLIKGDESGNLNLDKPIRRAEMITIMVRAMGAEEDAALYAPFTSFTDVKGHWAAGYITYAAAKGLIKGDGNNKARPDDFISNAEAMTMILRLIKQEPTSGDWPTNVLLQASNLGLLPANVTYANLNDSAIRGMIFQSFGTAVSAVKLESGKTVLQTYVAKNPPSLSITPPPSPTADSSTIITGTATNANAVTVNGTPATLSGNTFTATVQLQYGDNKFTVAATDLAGNSSSGEVVVTRAHPAATIEIGGPTKVRPGQTVNYAVSVKDKAGSPLPLTGVTAKVEGNLGTFDLNTGTFVASGNSGKGKLTITAGLLSKSLDLEVMGQDPAVTGMRIRQINNGKAVAFSKPMTVVVETVGANGFLDTDYGRQVTLAAPGGGVTIQPAVAKTVAGIATFTVTTSNPGTYPLKAAAVGITGDNASAVFGTNLHIQLVAEPTSLVVGGTVSWTRIRAELYDENGNLVNNNTGNPLTVKLAMTGSDGSVTDDTLTIAKGMSTSTLSGDDGSFQAGIQNSTAVISGSVSGTQITVDPALVNVTVPQVGPGSKLVVYPPSNAITPGGTATFTIRLEDASGNLIPSNSYAFQVKIDTSNNENKTRGIPDGTTVTLGDTGRNPVSDGIDPGAANDGGDIIGRTVGGLATVKVTYPYSGRVTVTPVAYNSYASAYSTDGLAATASSSWGLTMTAGSASFQGTVANLALTVDSDALGKGQPAGALSTSTGSTVTVNVTVVDGQGRWIPGFGGAYVTLARVNSAPTYTVLPNYLTAVLVDGKASFVIRSGGTPGTDTYKASLNGTAISSAIVPISVQNTAPSVPTIAAIRGVNNGSPGSLDTIAPDDTGMEVDLIPMGQGYVTINVYPEGWGSPIYSTAVDSSSGAPMVVVPKNVLPSGVRKYYVTARNGFGTSAASAISNPVTNATYNTSIYLSSARYDAATHNLYVYGAGFTGTDTVDTSRLTVIDGSNTLPLSNAVVTVNSWSMMTLNLNAVPSVGLLDDTASFNGSDMYLSAQANWLRKADGSAAPADLTGNPITPGAHLASVVYDRSNRRLNVYGVGFNTGGFDNNKLVLSNGSTNYTFASLGAYKASDTVVIVPLSTDAYSALEGDSTGAYQVIVQDGWFSDSGAKRPVPAVPLTIKTQVTLYGVTYTAGVRNGGGTVTTGGYFTITGSGFSGANVNKALLSVVNKAVSNGTPFSLGNATVTVTDTTIKIALNTTDTTAFEVSSYSGSALYLEGLDGWLVKSNRSAVAIPDYALRFAR